LAPEVLGRGGASTDSQASPPDPLLAIEGLDVAYGDVQVLWGVSLAVGRGEAIALIGSNGAGKTTLLRAISGTVPARRGRIRFRGEDVTALPPDRRVRLGVAHVPEGRQLFAGMTVRENLVMGAYSRRDDAAAVAADLEGTFRLFPVLQERRHQLAGTLSGGEQQMCAIGRGLMARPALLLIDELSLGLAPVVLERLVEAVRAIHGAGTTLLLVEQDVLTALDIAGRAYILANGRIVLAGESALVRESDLVREAYLGI
jgi:branched-chain amino acid transport system ATP-binding protein